MSNEAKNALGAMSLVLIAVLSLLSKSRSDAKLRVSTKAMYCFIKEFEAYQESCFSCTNQPYKSVRTCHEIARVSLENKIALCATE